ncbi:hypothetical protein [Hymenobacter sp. 102]|uniref:hypothetical protein n=1 Tax=Hymenobacter sp. 102 TaxID=3403152 RepID=UPI003CF16AE7
MLHFNQFYLMKRGSFSGGILRNDRKVVFPVAPSVFSGFAAVAASVSEAVFLCPARFNAAGTSRSSGSFSQLLPDDW